LRRNFVRALGAAGMSAALLGMAACQDAGSGTTTDAAGCGGKIAIFGAFTGPNAGLVIPSLNGAKLAVKKFTAANPDCKVTLQEYDTQGKPDQATPIANQVAQDQSFTSVIGGHFSGETKATIPTYKAAGLVMVAPSATAAELTTLGATNFFRDVGNDNTQGEAAVTYIKNVLKSQKAFVIDDGTPYGTGIIGRVKEGLGATVVGEDKVQTDQTNFDATISKVKAKSPDVIAWGGYTNEAAPFLKQARAAGVTAKFLGFDGLYDPAFLKGVGAGAEGAIVTCPCLPPDGAEGAFTADYTKEYGQAPGSYGAEGYDAAQILLDGYKAGKKTRAEMIEWVKSYDKQGASKYLKFDDKGDVEKSKVVIWSYEGQKDGTFKPQQEIKLS
jgi:branched-chain amino acid transport system substrate-binding protein